MNSPCAHYCIEVCLFQVDADSRKALYKLRLTWPQYFENRKLALIDRHVKALDPNWPVTAVKEGPPSPTIFVNPKFLEVRWLLFTSQQILGS